MNQRAFSLIELLVALTVLSLGLFALAGMQQTAINGITSSRHLTSAVFLAEAKMNELKTRGYSKLSLDACGDPENPVNSQGEPGGIFRRSWTISQYGANMKKITVTVSWVDSAGGSRTTSLNTVVSDSMD